MEAGRNTRKKDRAIALRSLRGVLCVLTASTIFSVGPVARAADVTVYDDDFASGGLGTNAGTGGGSVKHSSNDANTNSDFTATESGGLLTISEFAGAADGIVASTAFDLYDPNIAAITATWTINSLSLGGTGGSDLRRMFYGLKTSTANLRWLEDGAESAIFLVFNSTGNTVTLNLNPPTGAPTQVQATQNFTTLNRIDGDGYTITAVFTPYTYNITSSGLAVGGGDPQLSLSGTWDTSGVYNFASMFGSANLRPATYIQDVNAAGSVAIDRIQLITTVSADLTWVGDGSSNIWNVNSANNWSATPTQTKFLQLDNVTFSDTGSASPSINIADVVTPSAVTVNSSSKNYTFSGSGRISGYTGLTKSGTSTLTMDIGNNDYHLATTITGGTLSVGTLANGGTASGIGDSSNVATNLVLNGGTLQYTGVAVSTDRLFSVGSSGGTLDASGSGAVNFTNTGSMGFNSQTGTRTLTLTGTNTGANTIAAIIGDNTGATSLTKTGAGNWTLSGVNTYTGLTTVSAGTLTYGANNVIATGAVTVNGATAVLDLGANHTDTVGTVTVDGGGSITGTGTSALTSTGTFEMKSGSVSAILAGAVALNKTTTGTVTLSGANTYTGVTTISNGTLSAGNIVVSGGNSNLGNASSAVVLGDSSNTGTLSYTGNSATYTRGFTVNAGGGGLNVTTSGQTLTIGTGGVAAGGLFTVGGAGNTSITSVVSSTGGLTKTGAGTLTLSGNNTYTGVTTISNGTLSAGNIVVSGGNSHLGNASSAVVLGDSSNTGTLSYTGNSATYTRGFTVNAGGGGLNVTTSGQTLTVGTGGVTAGGLFTVGGAGNTTVTSVISSTGGIAKTGAGTLKLSGANTNTGTTTISGGTLEFNDTGVSSTSYYGGNISINNGSTMRVTGQRYTFGGLTFAFDSSGGGTIDATAVGLGGMVFGDVAGGFPNNFSSNTFQTNGGTRNNITGSGQAINLNGAATALFDVATGTDSSSDLTVSAAIWHTFGIVQKIGAGRLTLSGDNHYTGQTKVDVGTLILGSVGALGDGAAAAGTGTNGNGATTGSGTTSLITVLSGATLDLNGITPNANNAPDGGTFPSPGGGVQLRLNGSGVGGAGALVNNGGSAATYGGQVRLQTDTSIGGTGNLTLSNTVINSGGLTKVGAGTLTLSGANTYSGNTTVTTGTLKLGAAGVIPDGSGNGNVSVAATLDLNGFSETINGLSGAGIVDGTSGTPTFTVGANNQTSTFSGIIKNTAGTLALTKTGTGTLTLSGTNTFAGATTISNGTLQLSGGSNRLYNSGTTSAAAVDVASGATFDLNGNNQTIDGLTNSGSVTLGSGTLTVGNSSGTTTFGGVVSGTGGFSKAGSGTITLTNASTYSGATTVSAGTLKLSGGSNRLYNSGTSSTTDVSVSSGGVLDLDGTSQTIDDLTGAGGVTLNAGSLTVGNSNGSSTFSGAISTTGTLTKAGSG
ncbi:MAG: autotransporter-associated beta strand repeat-containing protein, partial [Planctomycetes bacterium]|nr:autotransporter-associated beta strand repeat-containing protein [Planctomycetota bacterium]